MKFLKIILVIVGAIFFHSCTPPLYIPNTTNAPVLLRQGDTEIGVSTGTNGWDVQAATAITNNIGIMLNGSFADHTGNNRKDFNKHHFAEVGLGYTYILNKNGDKDPEYFVSMFAGGGKGQASGSVEFTEVFSSGSVRNSLKGNYSRFFIQPYVGLSQKNVDFIFSYRISRVQFSDINYDLDWGLAYDPKGPSSNLFYEPTLTFKVGGERIKFFSQLGLSLGRYGNTESGFRQRPIIALIGIQANLNWKK